MAKVLQMFPQPDKPCPAAVNCPKMTIEVQWGLHVNPGHPNDRARTFCASPGAGVLGIGSPCPVDCASGCGRAGVRAGTGPRTGTGAGLEGPRSLPMPATTAVPATPQASPPGTKPTEAT